MRLMFDYGKYKKIYWSRPKSKLNFHLLSWKWSTNYKLMTSLASSVSTHSSLFEENSKYHCHFIQKHFSTFFCNMKLFFLKKYTLLSLHLNKNINKSYIQLVFKILTVFQMLQMFFVFVYFHLAFIWNGNQLSLNITSVVNVSYFLWIYYLSLHLFFPVWILLTWCYGILIM